MSDKISCTGNVTIYCQCSCKHRAELQFDIFPPFSLGLRTPPGLKGLRVVYKLRDDHGFHLGLAGKDARGNSVDFGSTTVEAISSDPAILTVAVEDGRIAVRPVGPLGTAQVQVTLPDVDADTEGAQPLTGLFDVEVVAGAAVSLSFEPADTFAVDAP